MERGITIRTQLPDLQQMAGVPNNTDGLSFLRSESLHLCDAGTMWRSPRDAHKDAPFSAHKRHISFGAETAKERRSAEKLACRDLIPAVRPQLPPGC